MTDILLSILEQGFIYGIMALGIYISYKILDFPDLSVDGSFPLGGAVTAALLIEEVNPWLTLLAAFAAGCLAGAFTGFLHVKLKIKDLLAGILTMTALYSINYRIAGAPNQFLMGRTTIFTFLEESAVKNYRYVIVLFVIIILVKILLDWYLSTKAGFLLRSVGDNEGLVITMAKSPSAVKVVGLSIANGLVALAGALNSQRAMQFDISSGTGTMVMGLAAVIIGITVFKRIPFAKITTGVLLGMIVYKACITLAIGSGMQSSDTNLIITVLFIVTILLNGVKNKKGVSENA